MNRIDSLHQAAEDLHVEPRPKLPNAERDFQLAKR